MFEYIAKTENTVRISASSLPRLLDVLNFENYKYFQHKFIVGDNVLETKFSNIKTIRKAVKSQVVYIYSDIKCKKIAFTISKEFKRS